MIHLNLEKIRHKLQSLSVALIIFTLIILKLFCKNTKRTTMILIIINVSNLVCFLNCIRTIFYPRIIDQCFVYFLNLLYFIINLELSSHPGWPFSHKLLCICILDTPLGAICNLLLVPKLCRVWSLSVDDELMI